MELNTVCEMEKQMKIMYELHRRKIADFSAGGTVRSGSCPLQKCHVSRAPVLRALRPLLLTAQVLMFHGIVMKKDCVKKIKRN